MYNTKNNIKFNTTIQFKSSLCDYSDAYILGKGWQEITGAGNDAPVRQTVEKNKGVILKNCAPFINCKSEINRNR